MDAIKEAVKSMLQDQNTSLRGIVNSMDAEGLNWKPLDGKDTNSIAILITHALDAQRALLAAAGGRHIERDRDATFAVSDATQESLLTLIDNTERETLQWIDELTEDQINADKQIGTLKKSPAWMFIHTIEHSNEHVGQALLTKQWYESLG